MSGIISSAQNSKVKFLRSLYRKKYRRKHKKFLLEGSRIITEALKENVDIYQVFYSDQFLDRQSNKELINRLKSQTEVIQITDSLLKDIADTETPQGIIAIVNQPEFELNEFLADDNDFFLIIDQVQDPGNLGTIMRTADGAGVDGIFILKGTVDIYNLKNIRATMGSIFRLPIFNLDRPENIKEVLQTEDIQVVAGEITTNDYYYDLDYRKPTALVVGNEGSGIRNEVLDLVDHKVKIPLNSGIDSLNVAIATGVMLYEVVRQRKKSGE
ncbi:TrmH family RNA methyltransferase [Selenihalanaerobacter shriftii]|uniref:RNA methyltransferase, TrmH family n=1 Tax=Selenihalanaerobacter shriftii TaxID=142842 RepID=A0A1T4QWU8_9FIRM|nr:RNA methyltransferase [Selenihalanaerobacter shriftii]SKA08194.1 RNA methyltransferase, TrmH family [Selenihalanaerobacter shriftii]